MLNSEPSGNYIYHCFRLKARSLDVFPIILTINSSQFVNTFNRLVFVTKTVYLLRGRYECIVELHVRVQVVTKLSVDRCPVRWFCKRKCSVVGCVSVCSDRVSILKPPSSACFPPGDGSHKCLRSVANYTASHSRTSDPE